LFVTHGLNAQDNWISLPKSTYQDLRKLYFVDSLHGWVVGDSGIILKTTDAGQSWLRQESGITEGILNIFMVNDVRGWALSNRFATDSNYTYYTIILSTTNGGDTWLRRDYPGNVFRAVFFQDSVNGWLGGYYGVIVRTTDGGETWSPVHVDSTLYSQFPILNMKFFNDSYGYAVGGRLDFAGVAWRTTDAGETWHSMAIGPEPVWDIHFVDSLNVYCVSGDLDFGAGLINTTNAGVTWTYRYLEIWGEARALAFRNGSEIWSPLGAPGTYMFSLDSGRTWHDRYTVDTSAVFDAMFVNENTGYMVGGRGTILRYNPLNGVRGTRGRSVPSTARLYQNFPNPFNPVTVIRYTLNVTSRVTLKVFDLLGREVAVLVEEMKESGEYVSSWDARSFPSGVYFCRLTTGKYVGTTKMVLLK